MSREYEGGCHCGAVRYTCTREPELTFYCHCKDCQKTTGSPFSVELMIADEGLAIDGPLESYVVQGDSGKPVTRWNCARCGSGLYLECAADPGYVFLKAGSLDEAGWVRPEMHIYTSAKQPWTNIGDSLPRFERAPDL